MSDDDTLAGAVDRLLDQELDSIRKHRALFPRGTDDHAPEIDRAWAVVLATATNLRKRVSGQKRLRYFNIQRDQSAITISFEGMFDGPREVRTFSLHRDHPDGLHPATHVIWCRETFVEERRFHSAEDAVRAMVKFCAVNMA